MPGELQGRATWPGAGPPIGCRYTCGHGTVPGVATYATAPTADLPSAGGALVLTDGRTVVQLPGCKVSDVRLERGPSHPVMVLSILDRRWKWEFGAVSGRYNQHDEDGFLKKETEKTPAELAKLCLEAMGERGYVVQGLPEQERPPVDWDAVNPAQALAALVEPLGCRVVYRPGSDTVLVTPLGVGRPLPGGAVLSESLGLDAPERPDALELLGAPLLWEAMLVLEAVGLDLDGKVRPLDELAYKPTAAQGGWERCPPPGYPGIPRLAKNPFFPAEPADQVWMRSVELARRTVYKWYRVKLADVSRSGGLPVIPGLGEIKRREQIVLTDFLLDTGSLTTTADAATSFGSWGFKRAEVTGRYWRARQTVHGTGTGASADRYGATPGDEVLADNPFTVDPERGLVMFERPVRLLEGNKVFPAELVYRSAVMVRDEKTDALLRYRRTVPLGPPFLGTKPAVIVRPEVKYWVKGEYQFVKDSVPPKWELRGRSEDAGGFALRLAELYLRREAARYSLSATGDRTYAGVLGLEPDGAIQQVTWQVGFGQAPTTRASLNTEHAAYLPSFPERRRGEYLRHQFLGTAAPEAVDPKSVELRGRVVIAFANTGGRTF